MHSVQCVTKTTTLIPGEQTAVKLTRNYPRGEGMSMMIINNWLWGSERGYGQHWLNAKGKKPEVFASFVNGICSNTSNWSRAEVGARGAPCVAPAVGGESVWPAPAVAENPRETSVAPVFASVAPVFQLTTQPVWRCQSLTTSMAPGFKRTTPAWRQHKD